MGDELYVVNSRILPEIFTKVLEVKTLIHTGKVKDISEGVKAVGILEVRTINIKIMSFFFQKEAKEEKQHFLS